MLARDRAGQGESAAAWSTGWATVHTAKVTAMVFAILIGSQMLNLVIISFGGEEYIQSFLRSFEDEHVVFLFVMNINILFHTNTLSWDYSTR